MNVVKYKYMVQWFQQIELRQTVPGIRWLSTKWLIIDWSNTVVFINIYVSTPGRKVVIVQGAATYITSAINSKYYSKTYVATFTNQSSIDSWSL